MVIEPPLPNRLDDLTAEWLSRVLGRPVDTATATVIGADRGFTGVVARVELAGDPSLPPSVIAKLPTAERAHASSWTLSQTSTDGTRRRRFVHAEREVSFHRDLASLVGDRTSRCLWARADPADLRVALLLEDLRSSRPGDVLTGCSLLEAEAVLDAVAPLHDALWEAPPPAWVPRWTGDPAERQDRYRLRTGPFLERYGDTLPSEVRALVIGLRSSLAPILVDLASAPSTVVHQDLHLDNVMFDVAVDRPSVILDWQGVGHGPAVIDLVDVLAGSLSPSDHADHASDVLDRWHDRLPERTGGRCSRERLADDYARALLRKLAGVVGWLATADPDAVTDREGRLIESAISDGRLVGALIDRPVSHLMAGR